MELGNKTTQGQHTTIMMADFTASYMIAHNLFVDLKQTYRKSESTLPQYTTTNNITTISFRLNIAQRTYDF